MLKKKGFTATEVIIVIAIAAIIFTISLTMFSNVSNYQSLEKDADSVIAYIQKARNMAVNSTNYSEYGIRFATTTISIFQGTTFSTASTTLVYTLSSKVNISAINLSQGVRDIYFSKITGKPSATGTVTMKSLTSTSTKSIIIYSTGISELQ